MQIFQQQNKLVDKALPIIKQEQKYEETEIN